MLEEILGKLGFDWKVALANLVNFFIIYLLLRNVVFRKIGDSIRERQDKIKKGLEDAEKARTSLLMAESEKQEILKDSHKEARKITEEAEKRGDKIVEDSKKEAGEESLRIKEKAALEMKAKEAEMQRDLQSKYVDLLVGGVEKVASQKIDREGAEEFTKNLFSKTA